MQAIDMHIHVPREPGLPEIEIEAEPAAVLPGAAAAQKPGGDGRQVPRTGPVRRDLLSGYHD